METAPYIAPRGRLPESTDPVKAQAWTYDAETRVTALVPTSSTTRQKAIDAWVYYRGFQYWAKELTSTPLKYRADALEEQWDKSQVEQFKQDAKFWLKRYRDLLLELGVTDSDATALLDVQVPKASSRTPRGWGDTV